MKMMTMHAALAASVMMIGQAVAGSLTPPPGPVSPSGPSLQDLADRTDSSLAGPAAGAAALASDVETRTDVQTLSGDATAFRVISAPGSYYLSADIGVGSPGVSAIRIESDHVTLDLNGHRLVGNAMGGGASAISGDNNVTLVNVSIENGFFFGWDSYAVEVRMTASRLINLSVSDCGGGLTSLVRGGNLAVGCRVQFTDEPTDLSFQLGEGDFGSVVADCHLRSTANGIRCGWGTAVRDCTVVGAGSSSFVVGDGTVLTGCVARDGQGSGFSAFTIEGVVLNACASVNNADYGYSLRRSTAFDCQAEANGQHGFRMESRMHVFDCTAIDHDGAGFYMTGQGNRVDSNHAATIGLLGGLGDYGFLALSAAQDCLVVRNSSAAMFDTFGDTSVNPSMYAPDWFNVTFAGPWDNLSQ